MIPYPAGDVKLSKDLIPEFQTTHSRQSPSLEVPTRDFKVPQREVVAASRRIDKDHDL